MNMIISPVTRESLSKALRYLSDPFCYNIRFEVIEPLNKSQTRWRVRLAVCGVFGRGARIDACTGRHEKSVCWHVYSMFFDSLPCGTRVRFRSSLHRCGDEWQNKNVGTEEFPILSSEACCCGGHVFICLNKQKEIRQAELDKAETQAYVDSLMDRVTNRLTSKYANPSD